jgi:hypothetical protein
MPGSLAPNYFPDLAPLRLVWPPPEKTLTFTDATPAANTAPPSAYISDVGDLSQPLENMADASPIQGDVMADPTREEFDAKLATVEARTETRFIELSGKIDRLSDAVSTFASNVRTQLADTRKEVHEENVFTRWTVVIAVVTSLIGAIAALWVTQGNLLSAFTAGLILRTETRAPPVPTLPPPPQRPE